MCKGEFLQRAVSGERGLLRDAPVALPGAVSGLCSGLQQRRSACRGAEAGKRSLVALPRHARCRDPACDNRLLRGWALGPRVPQGARPGVQLARGGRPANC